ncbi:MAG: hypothetical protein LJE70_00025 [Chromatiaceae bacterium]|jgi:hypothetical protein|nr:hypothetical protein [Chromatiaceae bacterium]
MNEQQWHDERDDRTLRYAERRLDPKRWIAITADPAYVEKYEGQVALLAVFSRTTYPRPRWRVPPPP